MGDGQHFVLDGLAGGQQDFSLLAHGLAQQSVAHGALVADLAVDGVSLGAANDIVLLGLIIAAGVFAAGLKSCGLISLFIDYLKNSSDVAKLGASFGPYLLGIITGSGNAAAFAFNEAVTPHAAEFGMKIDGLGYLAMIAAGLGRMSSPLAGGLILLSGIAGVSPIEVVKRTAPAAIITLGILYFLV